MKELIKIEANSENEVWSQISKDLKSGITVEDYHVIINWQNREIELDIDFDPGGGFEGGYEFTIMRILLNEKSDFRFIIHHESVINKIGKMLGMDDKETGYAEFDKKLFIKTNDIDRFKKIFADKNDREIFQDLLAFSLSLKDKDNALYLEFEIERAIFNINELKKIFTGINNVASLIESVQ